MREKSESEKVSLSSRRRFIGDMSNVTALTLVMGATGSPALAEVVRTDGPAPDSMTGTGSARVDKAYKLRVEAARFQRDLPLPNHQNNRDEKRYPNKIGNFSKGLPHNQYGEVNRDAYDSMVRAIDSGDPDDFERIQMGGEVKLTNPQGGLAFALEGPDPAHLYQPPAPAFASAEIAGEIVENYWMALIRDIFFLDYESDTLTNAAARDLSNFSDFRGPRVQAAISRARQGNKVA